MAVMVPLSDILAKRELDNELVKFIATDDWGQGRTCFGGFLSVLALVAMRDTMAIDAPLRSLQSNFVAPVPPGEVICRTRLLRQGKNVTQVHCEIWSEDNICGIVVGVFGFSRGSQLPLLRPVRDLPAISPDGCNELPYIPNVTPQFLQHLQMRWVEGDFPFSASNNWHSRIYLRTNEQWLSPEVQIVLLSDGPPSPALSFFNSPAMSSSVSWSLELPPMPMEQVTDGWFQIDMEVSSAAEGYSNLSSKLWTPSGQLASIGHQVVAIFG